MFYYLGAVLIKTEDTAVHFKYIQAAAKVGNLQEVERVTREDNFYDAEQASSCLRTLMHYLCARQWMIEDLCAVIVGLHPQVLFL